MSDDRIYKLPHLFVQEGAPRQLDIIVNYVTEASISLQADRDMFENRVRMYAEKAGISIRKAKQNIRMAAGNEFRERLQSYGL